MPDNVPQLTVLGEELASEYAQVSVEEPSGTAESGGLGTTQPGKLFPQHALSGRFHNSKTKLVLQHEKPWHRLALHYAARAKMNCKEIAALLNVSASSVQLLFRQPWFQEQYNQLAGMRAETLYETLMEGEDINSLLTLVTLRDDTNVKSATRVACATDILDRMKGKAVQRTLSVTSNLKQASDIDAMKAELVKLEAEEQQLLGASAKQPNKNGVIK